jgi:hypothetical protein
MTQLSLELPDNIARQAMTLAALEGKGVEDYVVGIVQQKLTDDPTEALRKMESFSDEDVLALADLKLTPDEDRRLGELLELNSAGSLTPSQRDELDGLMRLNMEGMLKKSLGWAEAVRRKLREPPQL